MPMPPKPLRPKLLFALIAVLVALSAYRLACVDTFDAGNARDAAGSAESATLDTAHLRGAVMGTTYSVKVVAQPGGTLASDTLATLVQEQLNDVDRRMSTYRADSELMRFNAYRGSDAFPVAKETAYVVAHALQISEQTHGAFDITVGPLVNAWGFGPRKIANPPTDAQQRELLARVGYRYLTVDQAASTLTKTRPDVFCDLSAIAKGYGVDRVAEALENHGYTRYMVEVGGEVRVRGHNARGIPWRLAVQAPDASLGKPQDVIAVAQGAVATSGDYHNFMVVDGKRVSHAIDPRSGRPASAHVASVTVWHPNSTMVADAFATAFMVLKPAETLRIAEQQGLAVMLVTRHEDGSLRTRANGAFEKLRVSSHE